MKKIMVIQGRELTSFDIQFIQGRIEANPSWHRTRLSQELCARWNWYTANGQLKDMACRSLLLKLERQGHITLPPSQRKINNSNRNRSFQALPHSTTPISCELNSLLPLEIVPVQGSDKDGLFKTLLSRYHYLGFSGTVGEHMKYLISDRQQRPLACLLFGSAAWKTAARDTFIGWDDQSRKQSLQLITNNMRFLILPWVRVRHLASYILARIARRISRDWQNKYGHRIHLLETFVECQRFRGTCYQAANWLCVGKTKGRSRNDRYTTLCVPVKDIYLYPLTKNFRKALKRDV